MSPEQVSGAPLDGRSDLYALGVVAFQVLSGRLPWGGLAAPAVLVALTTRPAPFLREVAPQLPPALASVVARCLATRPEDRFATGEALADALGVALEQSIAEAPTRATGTVPLPPGLPVRLDDAQAFAIWRRAAELQADASRQRDLEGAARAWLSGASSVIARPRDPTASHDRHQPESDATPSADVVVGYRVADVAAAAAEAGISERYVALALAELPAGTLPVDTIPAARVREWEARTFLGTDVRSLLVSHIVPASPSRTFHALGVVLQQAPYDLQVRGTVGAHPLDGGVIVFEFTGQVIGIMNATGGNRTAHVNAAWMQTQQGLEAKQLQVTLRAIPGQPDCTEVTVNCDVRPGVRRNVRVWQMLAGVAGSALGLLKGAALAKGAATALAWNVFGPAVALGLVAAGVGVLVYRRLYPVMLDRARREILGALQAVGAGVQSEEVFGRLPGPGAVRWLTGAPGQAV
jgi:hypothetical protein